MKKFATTAIIILVLHIITSTVCFADETHSFDGLVWEDANGNGIIELNESTISHVTVTVQTLDGVTVDQIAVDDSGYFISSQLPHGTYQVWTEIDGQVSTVEQISIGEVDGCSMVELAVVTQPNRDSLMHTIMLPLVLR